MTDRYHALTVILERDIREDDAESIIEAIKHIRFVQNVTGVVHGGCCVMAEMRAKRGIVHKARAALYDTLNEDNE